MKAKLCCFLLLLRFVSFCVCYICFVVSELCSLVTSALANFLHNRFTKISPHSYYFFVDRFYGCYFIICTLKNIDICNKIAKHLLLGHLIYTQIYIHLLGFPSKALIYDVCRATCRTQHDRSASSVRRIRAK